MPKHARASVCPARAPADHAIPIDLRRFLFSSTAPSTSASPSSQPKPKPKPKPSIRHSPQPCHYNCLCLCHRHSHIPIPIVRPTKNTACAFQRILLPEPPDHAFSTTVLRQPACVQPLRLFFFQFLWGMQQLKLSPATAPSPHSLRPCV